MSTSGPAEPGLEELLREKGRLIDVKDLSADIKNELLTHHGHYLFVGR